MVNRVINIDIVAEVAQGLKELKNKMVFVGGAIISLYSDDIGSDEIRPTEDVDLTIKLLNYSEWTRLEVRLNELGFYPDPEGHALCSHKYKEIPVDIMSTEDTSLGPSNKWYKLGLGYLKTIKVKDIVINILPAPFFIATKFEAYHDRGKSDYLCHDFEDIIYVLDNRSTIVKEISDSPEEVKKYLIAEFSKILNNPSCDEILSVHLHPSDVKDRLPLLKEKVTQIVNL